MTKKESSIGKKKKKCRLWKGPASVAVKATGATKRTVEGATTTTTKVAAMSKASIDVFAGLTEMLFRMFPAN